MQQRGEYAGTPFPEIHVGPRPRPQLVERIEPDTGNEAGSFTVLTEGRLVAIGNDSDGQTHHSAARDVDTEIAKRPEMVSAFLHIHKAILTDRKREILSLFVAGNSAKEIGKRCDISGNTVDAHLRVTWQQFGVASRTEWLLQYAAIAPQLASSDRLRAQRTSAEIEQFGTALEALTEQQRAEIELLVKGQSYDDIADSLDMPLSTVKNHFGVIFKKMNVVSRDQLRYCYLVHQGLFAHD